MDFSPTVPTDQELRLKSKLRNWGALLLLLFCQLGWAADLEVRAYRVSEPDGENYEVLVGSPFESRFFSDGDILRDYSQWGARLELLEAERDRAIWNETTQRMVVRGNRFRHREVVFHFSSELECQLRFGIRLVKVPGVIPGVRSLQVSDLPEDLVEIGQVGGLAKSGEQVELRGEVGEVVFEGAVRCWGGELSYQISAKLSSRVKGAAFEFNGQFEGLSGEEAVFEIGSRRGKETILAIVKGEVVFADGEPRDNWVLGEDGSQVWRDEEILKMRNPGFQFNKKEDGKIRRRFTVPPTVLTFLGTNVDDEVKDVRVLLMQNGVDLKDDDEVIFLEESSTLRVKVSPLELEMIRGIISTGNPVDFGTLHASVLLVESGERLDRGAVLRGEFRALSKVCHWDDRSGGIGGSVRMGDMSSEVEMQRGNDPIFWMSGLVRSKKGGEVRFPRELRRGVPVILQQMKVGKKWRAWVATVSSLEVEDYLGEE